MSLVRQPLKRGTGRPILLEYTDANGERSMRNVMPLAILSNGRAMTPDTVYLQARCSVAKASRTFRFDRIETLSDPGTGELIEVEGWFRNLHLSEGNAFDWHEDETATMESGHSEEARATTAARLPSRWKATVAALIGGYAIGRLRLAKAVLVWLHVRHGLWL